MTKQTEALKLALGALERVEESVVLGEGGHLSVLNTYAAETVSEAITALREALAEQPAPVPPAHKPLTDEQIFAMAEAVWRHGWASCRDAEYVGEEAESERWGEIGAEVVQNIAAHGITSGSATTKGNT